MGERIKFNGDVELNVLLLGQGIGSAQYDAVKWFDPEVVDPELADVRGHLVDPALPPREFSGLPHLRRAYEAGRLTAGELPPGQQFDVAHLASPSDDQGVLETLARLPKPPKLIILEQPVAREETEEESLPARLFDAGIHPLHVIVNEPCLFSVGLQDLHGIIDIKQRSGRGITDILIRSQHNRDLPDTEPRQATTEEAEAPETPPAFGPEFNSALAIGTLLSGAALSADHLHHHRSFIHNPIYGDPESVATYVEIAHEALIIRIAQGIGPFTVAHYGKFEPHPDPPMQWQASVVFSDGERFVLDLHPIFDPAALTAEHPYHHAVITAYDWRGDELGKTILEDLPIKTLLTHAIRRVRDPRTPRLPYADLWSALRWATEARRIRALAKHQPYPKGRPGQGRPRRPRS